MPERITIELVRAAPPQPVLAKAEGDTIDEALAVFESEIDGRTVNGEILVVATLMLDDGEATIQGNATKDGVAAAYAIFQRAKAEYMAGPGWGGPG